MPLLQEPWISALFCGQDLELGCVHLLLMLLIRYCLFVIRQCNWVACAIKVLLFKIFGGSVLSMIQVLFSFISKSLSYIFIPETTCKGGLLFYRSHLQPCHISFATVFQLKKKGNENCIYKNKVSTYQLPTSLWEEVEIRKQNHQVTLQ